MELFLLNRNDFNSMFVGVPHGQENNLGGNHFFADSCSFSPKVIDYVMKRYCVRSVLDVGSGLGYIPTYISQNYHVPVIGIDGLDFNVLNSKYPLVQHDLTKGPFNCSPVDLVTCIEVVEHIEPQYLDNLLDTITRGALLLMTHALPGTGSDFHVNEQLSTYWIEKLASRNFGILSQDTAIIRNLAEHEEHICTYFAQSGLLFGRLPIDISQQYSSNDSNDPDNSNSDPD